jgi:hypothetical protein
MFVYVTRGERQQKIDEQLFGAGKRATRTKPLLDALRGLDLGKTRRRCTLALQLHLTSM